MKPVILVIFTFFLAGCSKPDVLHYADNRPTFDIYEYFLGRTTGWGMIQDRNGKLTRQFVVDIMGSVDSDNRLVLKESFDWSDGEKSTRTWVIRREEDNRFSGTAEDVVGKALGNTAGNVLHWKYHLNVEVDDRIWKIYLDDWMFLQRDNVLINKTTMSKFGFHLGDITIVFRKDGQEG